MSKEFIAADTCSFKVGIFLNRDGNICQDGETVVGEKKFIFGGFASSITAAEAINDGENSPALHNGISGLIWLLSGSDENFNTLITRTLTEEVDDV